MNYALYIILRPLLHNRENQFFRSFGIYFSVERDFFLLLATEKKLWTSSFKISFFSAVYIMKKRKILLTRTYLISTPILLHSVDIGQFILSLFEQIISIFWSTNNHIFDLVFSTLMVKTSCET